MLGMLRRSAALIVMMTAMIAAPALAQQQPTPPEHYTLDPRGVDLVQGSFNYSTTDVVIGQPGAGGLSYGRVWTSGGWRDTVSGTLDISGSTYIVSYGGYSEIFIKTGSVFVPQSNTGQTLSESGSTITFTTSDGTVINYTTAYTGYGTLYAASSGLVDSVVQANGDRLNYYWSGTPYCSFRDLDGNCLSTGNALRLNAIRSNRGYQIKIAYGMDTEPYDGIQLNTEWLRRTSVVGVNLAVDYCDTNPGPCSGLTRTWPSATYDSGDFGGSVITVTDQSARTTLYSYNVGDLSGIRYPGSASDDVAVTYASGKVSGVTDNSGAWAYSYSDVGTTRTTTATGPLSQSMTVVSDLTTGRATSVTNALSQTTTYAYDGQRRLERVTNPEGDYTEVVYDARGNVTQTTAVPKSGSGPSNIVTTATYPTSPCASAATCNKPTSTTDARGYRTDYVWNSTHGGLESVTSPAPSGSAPVGSGTRPQTRITYAAQTAYFKNSGGTIVAASTSVTLPTATSTCATGSSPACLGTADETRTTVVYGSTGVANNLLPTSTTSGDGTGTLAAETKMTWTPDGDPLEVDGPLSGTDDRTLYRYDTARQTIGVIGPDPDGGGALLNRAMRMTYDSRGQVILTEQGTTPGYSDANWASFNTLQRQAVTYDGRGRPLMQAAQDAAGNTLQLVQANYDAAGRTDCTAVRMNPTVYSGLPGATGACSLTAPSLYGPDRITRMGYDALGRLNSTTNGYGSSPLTESVTYTTHGLPFKLTDSAGNVSEMAYDDFDRPWKMFYPSPTTPGATSTTDYEQYTYDIPANTTTYRTRKGDTFTTTADNLGRSSQVTSSAGMPTITYTYDNLSRMLTANDSSQIITRNWDALSRLTSEQSAFGTMSYQYDLAGRRTQQTWPGSAFSVTNNWNLYNEMTAILHGGSTQIIGYSYDNQGRRTGISRGNGVSSTYTYDGVSRLASLSHDLSGSSDDVTFTYEYNPAGQIMVRRMSNSAYGPTLTASSTAYTNNGLNRVTSLNVNGAGAASVTYDANGNITNDTARTITYDAASRVTGGPPGASLTYDALGRLDELVGGYGGKYIYDGVETVGFGAAGTTTLTNRFVRGPGVDEIVANFTSTGATPAQYWAADERGSLVSLTAGSTGATTVINTYDEYGVPASGNLGRLQYTGQLWLPDFGAYHYKARTYQPGLGRFLQTDPIGYAGGANLYAYVGADPVNMIDPSGLLEAPPTSFPCPRGQELVPGQCTWPDDCSAGGGTYFKTTNVCVVPGCTSGWMCISASDLVGNWLRYEWGVGRAVASAIRDACPVAEGELVGGMVAEFKAGIRGLVSGSLGIDLTSWRARGGWNGREGFYGGAFQTQSIQGGVTFGVPEIPGAGLDLEKKFGREVPIPRQTAGDPLPSWTDDAFVGVTAGWVTLVGAKFKVGFDLNGCKK